MPFVEDHLSQGSSPNALAKIASVKVVHEYSVATDKKKHVFKKSDETAVFVKGDCCSLKDGVHEEHGAIDFLWSDCDDSER